MPAQALQKAFVAKGDITPSSSINGHSTMSEELEQHVHLPSSTRFEAERYQDHSKVSKLIMEHELSLNNNLRVYQSAIEDRMDADQRALQGALREVFQKIAEDQEDVKDMLRRIDKKLDTTKDVAVPLDAPRVQQDQQDLWKYNQQPDAGIAVPMHANLANEIRELHQQHHEEVRQVIREGHQQLEQLIQTHSRAPANGIASDEKELPGNGELDMPSMQSSLSSPAPSSTNRPRVTERKSKLDRKDSTVKDNWYSTAANRGLKKYTKRGDVLNRCCCGYIRRDREPNTIFVTILHSHAFEIATTGLIMLNTFLVGYETDTRIRCVLKVPIESPPEWLNWADTIFTYVFLAELIFRLIALRSWFVFGDDWKWNMLDCFIVGASLIQHWLEKMQNVSFLRLMRIVRMVRVVRIIRVVRFFRELRKMVFSILSCLISLMWAFLLLLLIMFMFSMFFLQAIIDHIDTSYENTGSLDEIFRSQCVKWYSNTAATVYSLLLSISGGVDWIEVVTPLGEISEVHKLAFMCYIVFVIFGVLNVLTGVFLESAGEFMDRDLQIQAEMARMDKFVTEMHVFFKEFDEDNTGNVDFETFHRCMQDEKVQAYLASHQLDCTDAEQLYRLLDASNKEAINLSDFIIGLAWLKGSAKSIDVILLMMEMLGVNESLGAISESMNVQPRDSGRSALPKLYNPTEGVFPISEDAQNNDGEWNTAV